MQLDATCTDRSAMTEVRNPDRVRAAPTKLAHDQVQNLILRYQAGATVYDLAAQFDIHRQTVSTLLERSGVNRRYRLLGPDDIGRGADLYRAGPSLKRVATELGVTGETIRQAFLKNDVQIRPRPGRPAV